MVTIPLILVTPYDMFNAFFTLVLAFGGISWTIGAALSVISRS